RAWASMSGSCVRGRGIPDGAVCPAVVTARFSRIRSIVLAIWRGCATEGAITCSPDGAQRNPGSASRPPPMLRLVARQPRITLRSIRATLCRYGLCVLSIRRRDVRHCKQRAQGRIGALAGVGCAARVEARTLGRREHLVAQLDVFDREAADRAAQM